MTSSDVDRLKAKIRALSKKDLGADFKLYGFEELDDGKRVKRVTPGDIKLPETYQLHELHAGEIKADQTIESSRPFKYIVDTGRETYGISVTPPAINPAEVLQSSQISLRDFMTGKFSRRRYDGFDYPEILHGILMLGTQPGGSLDLATEAYSTTQKDARNFAHKKLLTKDYLSDVIARFPEHSEEYYFRSYEKVMYPFMKEVFEPVWSERQRAITEGTPQRRMELPKDSSAGAQGKANARMIMRFVFEDKERLDLRSDEGRQKILEMATIESVGENALYGLRKTVYEDSVAEMFIDYLRNHHNPGVKEYFSYLKQYHISNSVRWLTKEESRATPDGGWMKTRRKGVEEVRGGVRTKEERDVWVNVGLAREAMGEFGLHPLNYAGS